MNAKNIPSLTELESLLRGACPDDIDEEDFEKLAETVSTHFQLTGTREGAADGFLYLGAVVCPMYASESLSKYARHMEDLEVQGLRILDGQAAGLTGAVSSKLYTRHRDILVHARGPAHDFWARWKKNAPLETMWGARGNEPVTRLLKSVDERSGGLVDGWISALRPGILFSLKGYSDKEAKKVADAIAARLRPLAEPVLGNLLGQVLAAAATQINPEAGELVRLSKLPTIGLYNFLTAPPAAGANPEFVQRNRVQALQAMPNFIGMFADYHQGLKFHDDLRATIDRGERTIDFVADKIKVKPQAIKSFLKLQIGEPEGGLASIDLQYLRDYLTIIEAIPPGRAPANQSDLQVAIAMRDVSPVVDRFAEASRTTTSALWEQELKGGWAKMVQTYAPMFEGEPTADPIEQSRRAAFVLTEICQIADDLKDTAAYLAKKPGWPMGVTPGEVVACLLANKTIRRAGELLREWRTGRVQAQAAAMASGEANPKDAEWTPLLVQPEAIMIEDVAIEEIVNAQELELESQHVDHCVRGYGARCMQQGFRIFRFRSGAGRGRVETESGTLALVINQECTGFHEDQFRAFRNRQVGENLRRAADLFIERLRDGTIERNYEGYSTDRLRGFTKLQPQAIADRARFAVMDQLAAHIMPKTARGQSMSTYIQSGVFAEELRTLRAAAEAEAEKGAQEAMRAA